MGPFHLPIAWFAAAKLGKVKNCIHWVRWMQQNQQPKSGKDILDICKVVNGMWQTGGGWGRIDTDNAVDSMLHYANAGLTTVDMADICKVFASHACVFVVIKRIGKQWDVSMDGICASESLTIGPAERSLWHLYQSNSRRGSTRVTGYPSHSLAAGFVVGARKEKLHGSSGCKGREAIGLVVDMIQAEEIGCFLFPVD
ncbi:hypothetical protein Pint_28862 [Pistacia integerrima]|uniref:Uncharacterized protein n=1 Tax=Pistacia integerrima TaxID=434235 RepID=A0ACC0X365_9ROSI|nr:hypothetical protein Pint_28862 [Pistacia integerrima]